MKKTRSFLIGALSVLGTLLAAPAARAQVFDPNTPPARTSAEILADTTERREVKVTPAARRQKAAADSAKRTEYMFRAFGYKGIRLTRPGKAALLAALLPGAGQVYNHSYWKLPLVLGAVGGTIYGEYFYQKGFREFADAYNLAAPDPTKLHSPEMGPRARLYNSVSALDQGVIAYRGQRDIFYLYIGIAYGLQIVDALVDAHLKDFDVSPDLSLHWQPTLLPTPGRPAALPTNPGVAFALRVK